MIPYNLTLTLPERISLEDVKPALALLTRAMELHPRSGLVLDVSALHVFDSSALALLLALRRRQESRGRAFRVSGWPRRLNQLATLYGVRDLFST